MRELSRSLRGNRVGEGRVSWLSAVQAVHDGRVIVRYAPGSSRETSSTCYAKPLLLYRGSSGVSTPFRGVYGC